MNRRLKRENIKDADSHHCSGHGYRYDPRAEMPYWFEEQAHELQHALDQDSNLSIDEDYDPEADYNIFYFEEISRALPHLSVLMKYLRRSQSSL